jgi:predicted transcriptional regulator
MNKTSVYLTDDERDRLAYLARRTGKSQAEIIRDAIRSYERHVETERWPSIDGAGTGPGGSIADIPEEEYLKGFGQ